MEAYEDCKAQNQVLASPKDVAETKAFIALIKGAGESKPTWIGKAKAGGIGMVVGVGVTYEKERLEDFKNAMDWTKKCYSLKKTWPFDVITEQTDNCEDKTIKYAFICQDQWSKKKK